MDQGNTQEGERPGGPPPVQFRWLAEKLAIPLALILLPFSFQLMERQLAKAEREQQTKLARAEQNFRLYTDFLSKREEADTAVRRGLFEKLMGTYLETNPKNANAKLVQLELLALNFHESLNLNPLFWDLHYLINSMKCDGDEKCITERTRLQQHLDRVARAVKGRQAALLEQGDKSRATMTLAMADVGKPVVNAEDWDKTTSRHTLEFRDESEKGEPFTRTIGLAVLEHDIEGRRLLIQLEFDDRPPKSFWVDVFDFPMANFSRISSEERVAVMLDRYDDPPGEATLVLLYFPSSRSAAKDRPYIDELMKQLLVEEPEADLP